MVSGAGSLDVVIRTHDIARLPQLNRAVFSVALSDHRPLSIIIACQRFDDAMQDAVRRNLAPVLAITPDVGFGLVNRPDPAPLDARAALLNLGVQSAQGRYLAFLDDDDLIYPEAYRLLIDDLTATGAAIAFGGVLNADIRMGAVPVTLAKRRIFQGDGLRQLLHDNFCPLHSFVLDRSRLDPVDLSFDETLGFLEDYDFLLRVCARYAASFQLKDTILGEYLLKDDGSNVNPFANPATRPAWNRALAELQARKTGLVLSSAAQTSLGVDEPGLTVAGYLGRHLNL